MTEPTTEAGRQMAEAFPELLPKFLAIEAEAREATLAEVEEDLTLARCVVCGHVRSDNLHDRRSAGFHSWERR